jgi:opacity protein-like surface antigen
MRNAVLFAIITMLTATARAQDAAPTADKSHFSLFTPTPRELWRPMSADRPDFTESPYTVDAGAVQIEFSFIDYAKSSDNDTWRVAPVNLKLGLLNDVDLQIVVDPYINAEVGARTREGFGDMQFRLKMNLWGNDGGDTAFAVMPFIQIPTAPDDLGSNHVEGGVILPFATNVAEGVGLGLMFEADFVFDEVDDDYDTEFVGTGVLGFDVTDRIGLYVEGIGITSTDSDMNFRGSLGIGATYGLTANMVLDAGVNIGLTGDVDDVNLFSGITLRF